ncbi:MAG: hypothetical protein ACMXYD_01880 [Candidatus Woesearchaeota archaeon]
MGLFGSNKNDDTRSKIEELKAKMQAGGAQQPPTQQQAWQGQPQQPPQGWQPPRTEQQQAPVQQPTPAAPVEPKVEESVSEKNSILLELGEGMSLNLPIREKMELAEFLRIADRVRELKKLDHN